MSEEEIKELAREVGLDPDLLVLFEPHAAYSGVFGNGARQYRFEYHQPGRRVYDWNFVITGEEISEGLEPMVVKQEVFAGISHLINVLETP